MLQILFAVVLAVVGANVLDDYVNKEESVYNWWEDTNNTFHTLWGGKAHVLNVTSLKWLEEDKVKGPDGALWTHQVIVVVPKHLTCKNVSFAWITDGSNHESNKKQTAFSDYNTLIVDEIAHNSGCVTISILQTPNAPLKFKNDPTKKHRSNDDLLAQSWLEFLNDPDNEEWLVWLPMVKASYQCMRAAQDFLQQQGIADIEGWMVSGASKRGWASYLVASTNCSNCEAKIIAVSPVVPIVPHLHQEIHRQWQSYDGFTWAFEPYLKCNLTQRVDSPENMKAMKIIDPVNYFDRLEKIPKFVTVTSDDEFMQMDWTQLYWDQLPGEKHLLISPNTEHICVTGIPTILSTMGTFLRSIAAGHTAEQRPTYTQHFDNQTGEITVTVPPQERKLLKVKVNYGETIQSEKRDFRWVVAADKDGQCHLPFVPVPGGTNQRLKMLYGDRLMDDVKQCIQPIVWRSIKLKETSNGSGIYKAQAPVPKHDGHWVGYFISVYFEGDTHQRWPSVWKNYYHLTSKGWTNPNTLPFPDCHGESCKAIIV